MSSPLPYDDFEALAWAHYFLISAETYFVVEAFEDVPEAYPVDLSEVALVMGHHVPCLMPCCLMTLDCYCLEAHDCSEVVPVQDVV